MGFVLHRTLLLRNHEIKLTQMSRLWFFITYKLNIWFIGKRNKRQFDQNQTIIQYKENKDFPNHKNNKQN